MRAHRSGSLTTRRMEETPAERERQRHDLIGGDHEILNEIGGAVALAGGDIFNVAVVHDGAELVAVKGEGAAAAAGGAQGVGGFVLELQLRLRSAGATLAERAAAPSSHGPTWL